ncbi:MAG: hypothetical protein IAF38_01920 [Bacteroidia bacterium]|nr:hypothetical protein [Bacteroidia bacterium]
MRKRYLDYAYGKYFEEYDFYNHPHNDPDVEPRHYPGGLEGTGGPLGYYFTLPDSFCIKWKEFNKFLKELNDPNIGGPLEPCK